MTKHDNSGRIRMAVIRMDSLLLWVWLSLKHISAKTKIAALNEYFAGIGEIYDAESYDNIAGIKEIQEKELADKNTAPAAKVIADAERLGIDIITFDDKDYPEILKNIPDPPCVLYHVGETLRWDEIVTIGCVGTRRNSDYGKIVTMNICRDLARMGVVTVSGMAKGLDSVAAEATMHAGGKTVAVVGTGLDIIYPPENKHLFEKILNNGAVFSEYPPGAPASSDHFPQRNRIIAGLSRGILVTEAPKRSGALITARYALNTGRDLFAVPGNILDEHYAGSNALIQQGAKLVTCAEDIMAEYPYEISALMNDRDQDEASPEQSDSGEKEKNVPHISLSDAKYDLLGKKEKTIISFLAEADMQLDEIVRETEFTAAETNTMLVMLEMKGLVKRMPGNIYKLRI